MSAAVPLDTATVPFAALEHACEIADSASFENVSPALNTPTRLGGASAMRNRACTRYRRRCQPMIQIIIVCASPLTQPNPNPGVEDSSLSGASPPQLPAAVPWTVCPSSSDRGDDCRRRRVLHNQMGIPGASTPRQAQVSSPASVVCSGARPYASHVPIRTQRWLGPARRNGRRWYMRAGHTGMCDA